MTDQHVAQGMPYMRTTPITIGSRCPFPSTYLPVLVDLQANKNGYLEWYGSASLRRPE